MWKEFWAWPGASLWRVCSLVAVLVLVVGGLRLRAVVGATRGPLVRRRLGRSVRAPVRRRGGGSGPGLVVRAGAAPLALVVGLLRVGLPLHPPLLHGPVAARVVLVRAGGAARAAGLAARAVPAAVRLAVGGDALPVAALALVLGARAAVPRLPGGETETSVTFTV